MVLTCGFLFFVSFFPGIIFTAYSTHSNNSTRYFEQRVFFFLGLIGLWLGFVLAVCVTQWNARLIGINWNQTLIYRYGHLEAHERFDMYKALELVMTCIMAA